MAGWLYAHCIGNGHGVGHTLGDGEGHGGLVCCNPVTMRWT